MQAPMDIFAEWFAEAKEHEVSDPNAVSVATVDKNMLPNVRILLMKGYDARGFVIYTNYNSQKGQELTANPKVGLCFHWKSILKQVRIRGEVEKLSNKESTSYFHSRDRLSQIGAWVSDQSRELHSRENMLEKLEDIQKKFADNDIIPKPDYWGGYLIKPLEIEFWRNGSYRLHDRLVFTRNNFVDQWASKLLYP
ncbi:MAG: pyridoxamine 5'-phosphate oxidase [Pseudomonadota bacterium]